MRYTVLTLVLMLVSGNALAHGLKLFATRDADQLSGYVYHSGGGRAVGVPVTLMDAAGRPLANSRSGSDGTFQFAAEAHMGYLLQADSGDGHMARRRIKPAGHADPAHGTDAVLDQLVALRQELHDYQEQRRWSDVLGGIGYIFGIAGIVLYLQTRKKV